MMNVTMRTKSALAAHLGPADKERFTNALAAAVGLADQAITGGLDGIGMQHGPPHHPDEVPHTNDYNNPKISVNEAISCLSSLFPQGLPNFGPLGEYKVSVDFSATGQSAHSMHGHMEGGEGHSGTITVSAGVSGPMPLVPEIIIQKRGDPEGSRMAEVSMQSLVHSIMGGFSGASSNAGPMGGNTANGTVDMSVEEAEKSLAASRKETEALERRLNNLLKRNRKIALGPLTVL